MAKILGLDLGTNSVGWALRDTDIELNQIIDYGVVVFKKGVGDGKSGEFSLAAERRKNRSKRRLYNAKRYRKWATLKVLMQNGMCPITDEELRLWSIGDWKDYGKNMGRVYPTSPDFKAWLAMDFERIEKSVDDEVKLKPAFNNIYLLRCRLLENFEENDPFRMYKIGRAFYHLVQRRGFKSSRKSGKSTYGENEYLKKTRESNPDLLAVQILQHGLEKDNRRIRNSGVLQRNEYEKEFYAICNEQQLSKELIEKLYKAIYYVRPLRTQKGLVGKCTLEKGKPRIPISHPVFEEFRTLQFINNIKWREANSKNEMEYIPMELKKKIFEQLYFKRKEKGKEKGKVHDRTYFEFQDLINEFSEKGKWEFNYKNKPNVSTCPVIAGLMNVFDEDWQDKFITDKDRFGINWNGLSLVYTIKYGKKEGKIKALNYQEIWHLLFDFIQTKDNEEDLIKFCKDVIGWDEEKTKLFTEINIQQGYGSLSQNAIDKIIPFLQDGYIYPEAVSFANLSKVLGEEKFNAKKESITINIADTIKNVDVTKAKLNIVNSLIQRYFSDNNSSRAKGVDNHIKEMAYNDVEKKLTADNKQIYLDFVLEKYLSFLDGKQDRNEKASSSQNKNPEIDYYKIPRLDEAIKQTLINKFEATEEGLKHLYHPSDIDIYPKAKNNCLEDPRPPSRAWKNPMAMRTMHEMKKLINYLLDIGKIDIDTKIIIEMARELNDANKRWAIQTYQKRREEQNIEFAKAIIGVAKEKYPNLNEEDADNIDKIRLWWEQIENGEEVYKEIKTLKEDVQKYRLWKEQECQCLYTGKMIKLVDLFDGISFDFEHTLPLSDSFDNSLANLTICETNYNRNIKKDQFPTQLKNYAQDWNGYSAIKPRLKPWVNKVSNLKGLIEDNKLRTKKTQDIETKNDLIKKRHLLQFEFDYWDKKMKTFTLTELPNWWKNSQLVDTQIISKYARAYLKSFFQKVDVQKGNITAEFRKIYGIMGDEKKDRSKHSHHAKDAAVLTLIPGSAKRENILMKYFEAKESKQKFENHLPYPEFHISHIIGIEEEVLINHVSKDQTLTQAAKKVRKRSKIVFMRDERTKQYLRDKNGKRIPMMMQGDSIRGQLHKETYFGAIKVPERNENGFAFKKDGKYVIKQKNNQDELWIVVRKPINSINIDKDTIIDELLKKHIKQQLEDGKKLHEIVDLNNNPIRHVRCRVAAGRGYLTPEKAIELRKHSHPSIYPHKKFVLAQNEENYLYLLYETNIDENKKIERADKIISLFDFNALGFKKVSDVWNDIALNKTEKGKFSLPLKYILKVGQKAIFFNESKDELKSLDRKELNNQVFVIYKFNEMGTPYIYMQNHIEAQPDKDLDDGDTAFIPNKYQYRLKLKADKMSCVIENIDFNINPDGEIKWL